MTTIQGKAAVLFAPNTPLEIVDVNFEAPKAGEVRVKVKATGLCHSDTFVINGIEICGNGASKVNRPLICGHEGAGIVESVGQGVAKVKPGDHVIVQWMVQCNQCVVCTQKPMSNLCANSNFVKVLFRKDGSSRIKLVADGTPAMTFLGAGTFADYVVLEETKICKIDESIPLDLAALVGCCLGTGYGSATSIAKVTPGSVCAVWGLGAVGLSTIIGCKAAGAGKIFAIDRYAHKAKLAKELGATGFLSTSDQSEEEILATLKAQGGIDFAFECLGAPICMAQAQKSLAPWGAMILVGLHPTGTELTMLAESLLLGQTVTGGYYGRYKPIDGIKLICKEIVEGRLESAQKLITHRMPLDKINEGFDLLKRGEAIRTIIEM